VKKFHMKSHVKFHKWKDFTWNHMWHFTCERISHEITSDILHMKGFHMKLQITSEISHLKRFHMKLKAKSTCERIRSQGFHFHMKLQITKWNFTCTWKDFTWNYRLKWYFTCERTSHEIINYKWNFTCERNSHEIINYNEISHVKVFHMKL
jgi:hypothetical protein